MMIREPSRCWVPNLQITRWEWDPSESNGGAPSPFPINAFSINFNANANAYAPCAGYSSPLDISNASAHTHRHFISNEEELDFDTNTIQEEDFDMSTHAFSSDHFRMFEFKVRMCPRARSHDWTHCPYAHPSEKARRRDPRKFHYSGTPCPDFRKGSCSKGESCEFAHGVFECWLHPSRYRTQLCKDGTSCRRPVCFFAHTPEQLRVLPHESGEPSLNGSPIIRAFDSSWNQNASLVSISSPTSVLNSSSISLLSDSPPKSPGSFNRARVSEIVSSMRSVQLDKEPSTRMGSGFGSPSGSTLRRGFFSLPSTPKSGWNQNWEEEPAMERVESGRDLRARIYARLSKENSFGPNDTGFSVPDIGWVSELVK